MCRKHSEIKALTKTKSHMLLVAMVMANGVNTCVNRHFVIFGSSGKLIMLSEWKITHKHGPSGNM